MKSNINHFNNSLLNIFSFKQVVNNTGGRHLTFVCASYGEYSWKVSVNALLFSVLTKHSAIRCHMKYSLSAGLWLGTGGGMHFNQTRHTAIAQSLCMHFKDIMFSRGEMASRFECRLVFRRRLCVIPFLPRLNKFHC